ncbi:MAG: hypothetical protein GOV02_02725 [Candidatus Aenigmarchaeota archaeon]|nr:hypothetical protein [Candidatus Aenigmarchaeota archaeon]
MKVKQRQAMSISIKDLRKLADELEKDLKKANKEIGINMNLDQKWSVSIINHSEESDTWMFE